MPLRIAVAGISHETNTFAPRPTDLEEFINNRLLRGEEMYEEREANTVIGGAVAAIADTPGLELVPLVSGGAIPGGIVTARAVEAIEGEFVAMLAEQRPDAVVLALHGAMVTERAEDGEAATLRRVRDAVGPEAPVVAVLDLHANVSQAMVDFANVLLPYDTYPHVDSAERGQEAVHLAARMARGELRPVTGFVKLPMISPCPKQFTGADPAKSIMAHAHRIETMPGVLNAGVNFGFAYADIPIVGKSVLVTTDGDKDLAHHQAQALADDIWARREEFRPETMPVEEAIHAAMEEVGGPVVLADQGDNPGGGSPCDGTAILWGLLDLGAPNAALATIADREAVDAAFAAGTGARLEMTLGGKTDDLHGYPIPITATVRSLSDGDFVYEGPMQAGRKETLGRTAVLVCDGRYGNSVEVIVCERRVQPIDLAIFHSQGIEPTERKIIALKSAVHFRSSFGPIARRIIEVDTPGLTSVNFSRFDYRRIPRPIWPLDPM
ncbi:MAG: M81 family metallopeptidase [Thermomicrobiales bacterium]